MMAALQQKVRKALSNVADVDEGQSIFSDDEAAVGFYVNAKQVAHFIADDSLELRLTRKAIGAHRTRLKADPRVVLRRGASDWLIVAFATALDVPFIVELAEIAAAAHRPAAGVPAKPPPIGADLARRRRFH